MRTNRRIAAFAALVFAVVSAIVASAALASTFGTSDRPAGAGCTPHPHLALRGPQPPGC
jgi:hypothetical protein